VVTSIEVFPVSTGLAFSSPVKTGVLDHNPRPMQATVEVLAITVA